jgi:hypothetical protein
VVKQLGPRLDGSGPVRGTDFELANPAGSYGVNATWNGNNWVRIRAGRAFLMQHDEATGDLRIKVGGSAAAGSLIAWLDRGSVGESGIFDYGSRAYSDSNPPGTLLMAESGAVPATPAAGLLEQYADTSGVLWSRSDDGVIRRLANPDTDNPLPEDNGLKAWSMDPATSTAVTILPTSGMGHFVRMSLSRAQVISSLWVYVSTAGASLTNVGFALYDAAGNRLTSSVNTNGATTTAFSSLGAKQVTFSAPPTIPAGNFFGFMWFAGTTMPTLNRGATTVALHNINLSPPNLRFGTSGSGLTTTAPATITTQASNGAAYWMGAS